MSLEVHSENKDPIFIEQDVRLKSTSVINGGSKVNDIKLFT